MPGRLNKQILLWAQDEILSPRVIYICGSTNVRADLLSRWEVTHRDWRLHPNVVRQIQERYYEAEVDLFALKETCNLQALSVLPSCLDFAPGLIKDILHHHPDYLPNLPFLTIHPGSLLPSEKQHLLCQIHALQIYIHHNSQWRKSEQLLICHAGRNREVATTKQTMSHWVRDAITLAYPPWL